MKLTAVPVFSFNVDVHELALALSQAVVEGAFIIAGEQRAEQRSGKRQIARIARQEQSEETGHLRRLLTTQSANFTTVAASPGDFALSNSHLAKHAAETQDSHEKLERNPRKFCGLLNHLLLNPLPSPLFSGTENKYLPCLKIVNKAKVS